MLGNIVRTLAVLLVLGGMIAAAILDNSPSGDSYCDGQGGGRYSPAELHGC